MPLKACALAYGMSQNALDCNDHDPLVGQFTYYEDKDQDGYGDPAVSPLGCTPPTGYVQNNLDCDDHHGKAISKAA